MSVVAGCLAIKSENLKKGGGGGVYPRGGVGGWVGMPQAMPQGAGRARHTASMRDTVSVVSCSESLQAMHVRPSGRLYEFNLI